MDPVQPVAPVVEAPKNPAIPEAVVPEPKKETVGEVLDPKGEPKKEETVPLSAFLEMKKENKELAQQMKDLKTSIEQGGNKKEISAEIKALSEKHGVDAEFLQEFAESVRQGVKTDVEDTVRPLNEKERSEKVDKAFNEHYSKALEEMPEFNGVVNKDVIKTLSLNPANRNKTFTQIIEEAYGHLVQGRRTIDSGSPAGTKDDPTEVDMDKARTDNKYFAEIMKDPVKKKKYNESLTSRVSSKL